MFKVDGNNISMIRGDSGVFTITITDTNGSPVELTEGDVYAQKSHQKSRYHPAKNHCWR